MSTTATPMTYGRDASIARFSVGRYQRMIETGILTPEVGLIVEVADSSLLRDQRDNARIYARAAVPCYWIVNLPDARIEVYTQPSGPTDVPDYADLQIYQAGDDLPLVLDGAVVAVIPAREILP